VKKDIEIIYEDGAVIAVNKPSGLATVRQRNASQGLADILSDRSPEKIFVVHRLDKETSGVILFAKNARSHRELSGQFEHRTVTKIYLGLVEGAVEDDEATINLPISPEKKNRFKMHIDKKGGKESVTRFSVEKRFQHYSLLKITPRTGRMHQIRVHLWAFGHPIVCDALYGSKNPLFLSKIKRHYRPRDDRQEKPILSRLALHAERLAFVHPETGKPFELKADIPKDFRLTLRHLEKYSFLR